MNLPQLSTLELKLTDKILQLTIHRPQALNALNSEVINDLNSALKWCADQSLENLRALLITGSGEKAFVAGADIKEMQALSVAGGQDFAAQGQRVFRGIEQLQIPVLAAVNGFALGGGLELALACDFIYASDNAKLGLPEVTLGLIPGFGGTVRLSRAVGLNRAKEMVYTGEMLTAADALTAGLVNKVMPQAELLPTALKTLQTISNRAPVAVSQAKKSVAQTWDQDVDAAMQTEAKYFGGLFATADFKEGTSAFVEKRKPAFKGH